MRGVGDGCEVEEARWASVHRCATTNIIACDRHSERSPLPRQRLTGRQGDEGINAATIGGVVGSETGSGKRSDSGGGVLEAKELKEKARGRSVAEVSVFRTRVEVRGDGGKALGEARNGGMFSNGGGNGRALWRGRGGMRRGHGRRGRRVRRA
jgi:hypothetical protein